MVHIEECLTVVICRAYEDVLCKSRKKFRNAKCTGGPRLRIGLETRKSQACLRQTHHSQAIHKQATHLCRMPKENFSSGKANFTVKMNMHAWNYSEGNSTIISLKNKLADYRKFEINYLTSYNRSRT